MIPNDGRNFLLLTKRRYDVMSTAAADERREVNHLYSRDFLEPCAIACGPAASRRTGSRATCR
jgi:hypothetical protein